MSSLEFPTRISPASAPLPQSQRLELLRTILRSDDQDLTCRVAGILFLLFGQPVTRIVHLTLDDVDVTDSGISLNFGDHVVSVPEPFGDLIRRYLDQRPNIATAGNSDSRFLFVGYTPGKPLNPNHLARRLRQNGIDLRAAKAATLRELVQEIPPPVAAQALGYRPQTMERHAAQAGNTWASYPAHRRQAGPKG
jgi:integrase